MAVKEKEGLSKMKLLNAWKLDNGQLGRHSQDMVNGIYRTTAQFQSNLLPAVAAPRDQSSTLSYDAAVMSEAHGIITDLLAVTNLPAQVVNGLKAVGTLLRPPSDNHSPASQHRHKISPLLSLTEASSISSDNDADLPYTGERPSTLPGRFRRSLPPGMLRRMSTSTWTTTTSATGLPTVETETVRTRHTSFRQTRDASPSSSPTGSRSNSPSPGSPTSTVPSSPSVVMATMPLIIPKNKSPSSTGLLSVNNSRRKTSPGAAALKADLAAVAGRTSSVSEPIDGLMTSDGEPEEAIEGGLVQFQFHYQQPQQPMTAPADFDAVPSFIKRLHITSDYESSDSPSSGEQSDSAGRTLKQVGDRQQENSTTEEEKGQGDHVTRERKMGAQPSSSPVPAHVPSLLSPSLARPSLLPTIYSTEEIVDVSAVTTHKLLNVSLLNQWDYPIFDLASQFPTSILSLTAFKLFSEVDLFNTFRIPETQFVNYFHALELGYKEKPYHNRIHAADVLHGVYYMTTQPVPGFHQLTSAECDSCLKLTSSDSDCDGKVNSQSYGIVGCNFPALELMALYTAAAMHDYDHPGRTNAFLVMTHAPLAILYNDRSVLENHHAASAWRLYLSDPRFDWLCNLNKGEFNRFRFLVIEAILATDLKRHFELVADFNSKVNNDDAAGIDWSLEADRLMVSNMIIKAADINGPSKRRDLHENWTARISEEFYEQGNEEERLGLPISMYMDRREPHLARLQESFITHLVGPLFNAVGAAGLLPGSWVDESDDDATEDSAKCTDEDDFDKTNGDTGDKPVPKTQGRPKISAKKVTCPVLENLKSNHLKWIEIKTKEELEAAGAAETKNGTATETAASEKDDKA